MPYGPRCRPWCCGVKEARRFQNQKRKKGTAWARHCARLPAAIEWPLAVSQHRQFPLCSRKRRSVSATRTVAMCHQARHDAGGTAQVCTTLRPVWRSTAGMASMNNLAGRVTASEVFPGIAFSFKFLDPAAATLFSRSQSDRTVLRKTQSPFAQGRRTINPRPLGSDRHRRSRLHTRRVQKLFYSRRIQVKLTGFRSNSLRKNLEIQVLN